MTHTPRAWVAQRADSGACGAASEYVRDLIRKDQAGQRREKLRAQLEVGLASVLGEAITAIDWVEFDTARRYAEVAGIGVAPRFDHALTDVVAQFQVNSSIGSPRLGQELGAFELRTWRLTGFPAALWKFERAGHLDVVRVVG